MDMEEKFLKARQEREEQRLGRAKEVSEATVQRQLFDDQATELEQKAEALLKDGDGEKAQAVVSELRALVLDASGSVNLTAHDMAKANATVARLQQAVDGTRQASPLTSSTGARRFKFSKKVKESNVVAPAAPVAEAEAVDPSTGGAKTAAAGSQGATYGPASEGVVFVPHSSAAFIQNCTDCTVLAVPIAGSVFVSNCSRCRLYVSCHQLRMKDCHDVDVYVWCASTPIIEHSEGMRFGPYQQWSGLLQSTVTVNGQRVAHATHGEWVHHVGGIEDLERTKALYTTVDDFQWLKKTQSPNWRTLADEEMKEATKTFPPEAQ